MAATLRENLIATMGRRAGNMEGLGLIEIPMWSEAEDEFADFCAKVVDGYMNDRDNDEPFDLVIEGALMRHYDPSRVRNAYLCGLRLDQIGDE